MPRALSMARRPIRLHQIAGAFVANSAERQSAGSVLMVRPAHFGFNEQTAASNAFQYSEQRGASSQKQALKEFDDIVDTLMRAGVEVLVAEDSPTPIKPDAIFPNNWVSFHHDGSIVLYPMMAANRRLERRLDILQQVAKVGHFQVSRTVDLTHREAENKFLEGTGSLVLDRVHRIAYSCFSPRTDLDVLGEFAQLLDYELLSFEASDQESRPIYHTNVMMAVGATFAVLCAESIANAAQRAAVLAQLQDNGHEVIEISRAQMASFAGNMLELATETSRFLVLSRSALMSLDGVARRRLEAHATLLPVELATVERIGGGGVRCMLAEVHLPKRDSVSAPI